jgi:hypothetical protein
VYAGQALAIHQRTGHRPGVGYAKRVLAEAARRPPGES